MAVYGTTLQLFSGFAILISTLNSIIYPKLAKIKKKEEFKKVLITTLLFCFIIICLIFPFYFTAEWIFRFLFDEKYIDSIPIFKIMYPNYLLQFLFAPLGIALFALGLPKVLMILAFIRLISGFIFDLILIPVYGVEGAAYSFFLGQVVSWVILILYFIYYFRKNSFNKRFINN